MATRRQAIMARVAELKDFRAHRAAELQAADAELQDLENELRNTVPDLLDFDASARRNEVLRQSGLLPSK